MVIIGAIIVYIISLIPESIYINANLPALLLIIGGVVYLTKER